MAKTVAAVAQAEGVGVEELWAALGVLLRKRKLEAQGGLSVTQGGEVSIAGEAGALSVTEAWTKESVARLNAACPACGAYKLKDSVLLASTYCKACGVWECSVCSEWTEGITEHLRSHCVGY